MSCNLFAASKRRGIQPILDKPIDTLQNVTKTVTHVVRKGETLSKIADKYKNITYQDIAKENGLNDPNNIYIGQRLKIPNQKPIPKTPTPNPHIKPVSDETSTGRNKESGCGCPPATWMKIAEMEAKKHIQRYHNQKKIGNNPEIMKYHNTTNIFKYDNRGERVSWCGTFINFVMKKAGYQTFSTAYRAKDWGKVWGAKEGKEVSKPIYGAIGVKSRKGGGHVAFVVGVDNVDSPKYVYMLGGNQWGYVHQMSWGTKIKKNGKQYVKSVLYPSKYKISDWSGFYVPKDYNTKKCKLKKYTGGYIISRSDGN